MPNKLQSICVLGLLLICAGPVIGGGALEEKFHYLRLEGKKFATECRFLFTGNKAGWSITSWTERGPVQMKVESRYDAKDHLLAASAVLTSGTDTKTATVTVKDGKATIQRPGQPPVTFDAPKGTIVTSAPDWTDVFLLCHRYDRQRKGKQEFPALWIHPTQPPLRLTFAIEEKGTDVIALAGKQVPLSRYLIHIRNNSSYLAWANAQGQLVRLLPLPVKDKSAGLYLEGHEKATADLGPGQ